ncbi:glycosyltransferase family 2 protein [Streptomyces sp. B1866]|uniref:glycosyltransferase n=1 Tax=Streptomyces sp. B1866 TaxID=3075431 RepID=UPI00288D1093|nr:glycosyltransferase family 2 protein [Streptomyces sp. B1866]MDT3395130.1 glycosyltransferase family 2 protein [Streptomyces sp. B1866]
MVCSAPFRSCSAPSVRGTTAGDTSEANSFPRGCPAGAGHEEWQGTTLRLRPTSPAADHSSHAAETGDRMYISRQIIPFFPGGTRGHPRAGRIHRTRGSRTMSMLAASGVGAAALTISALALARNSGKSGEEVAAGDRRTPRSVSVVIPAHNEETTIAETIRSCRAQTHPLDQIIVVADNCSDRTTEIARGQGAVVIEGRGGSKASAQNLALPHITSDAVVALDADATLSPDAVELMMGTLRGGRAGTCTSARPKDTSTVYSQYRTLYHAIANGWVRPLQDRLGRQLVLSGMSNCHRTDVLREVGGFPDDNITEDFNLTWTLHRRAQPVGFTPKAFVYTQEPASLSEILSQMHRWTAGFAQTMVRHRTPLMDVASLIVVGTQVVDAALGGVAICSLPRYLARHGCPRGLLTWWSPLWAAVMLSSLGVAVRQLGWRTTAKCLPGWVAMQGLTGPLIAWWLFREWVLGRHLTTWTGRHGCRPAITPMPRGRKAVLAAGGLATAALLGVLRAAPGHDPSAAARRRRLPG